MISRWKIIIEHFWPVAVALLLALGAFSWVQEHDIRLRAEQITKDAQAQVKTLQAESAATKAQTDATIKVLKKQAAAIKTPAQAIAAIPDLSSLPLHATALPDAPSMVAVEAVPLAQVLSTCKQNEVALGGCAKELDLARQTVAVQEKEIKALKHPVGFWKGLKRNAETIGIGVAVGFALAEAHR